MGEHWRGGMDSGNTAECDTRIGTIEGPAREHSMKERAVGLG